MVSDSSVNPDVKVETQHNMNIVPKPKTETRSRRINLLITPSVYSEAQIKCEQIGISLNECINQFLTNWVKK